jgi:hypothetical protein
MKGISWKLNGKLCSTSYKWNKLQFYINIWTGFLLVFFDVLPRESTSLKRLKIILYLKQICYEIDMILANKIIIIYKPIDFSKEQTHLLCPHSRLMRQKRESPNWHNKQKRKQNILIQRLNEIRHFERNVFDKLNCSPYLVDRVVGSCPRRQFAQSADRVPRTRMSLASERRGDWPDFGDAPPLSTRECAVDKTTGTSPTSHPAQPNRASKPASLGLCVSLRFPLTHVALFSQICWQISDGNNLCSLVLR